VVPAPPAESTGGAKKTASAGSGQPT